MADEGSGKYRKVTHTVYQCNYHIVWVPKYRYRVLEGPIKESVEHDTRALCEWKEVEVIELSVQPDHIHLVHSHLVCSIPPKLAVSRFMGFLKGKLAIKMFKSYPCSRATRA
jgi:putative transposase